MVRGEVMAFTASTFSFLGFIPFGILVLGLCALWG